MHSSQRNSLIERLAEAMRVIGLGGTFERFGQIFMDHYLGIPLSHRGLNVLGNPVGGTIDTKDDMARYAAEYSGEMTYFAGDMAKPTTDLDHVLKLHPGIEHIFLLSSQTAPTGKIEAFAEGKKKDPAFKGKVLHLYDARRILALGPHLRRLDGQDVGHRACLAELFRQSLSVAARQGRRVILRGHPDIQAQRDRIGKSGADYGVSNAGQHPSSSCLPVRCWQVLLSSRCATSFQTALPPYNRTASAVWISTVRSQRRQETRSTWR